MSQNEAVLSYLKAGNALTPLDALQRFGIMRLGARCYELKRQGHPIVSEMVRTTTGKIVARYSLVHVDTGVHADMNTGETVNIPNLTIPTMHPATND